MGVPFKFLLWFLVGSVLAGAQQVTVEPTASLLVNVMDLHGTPVPNLTKENFRVRVKRRSMAVLESRYTLAPRRIVILLDSSGSMAGSPEHTKWKLASEAAGDLLADSPRDVQIALLTFSDQVHDVFDFSQTRTSMASWVKAQAAGERQIKGRTAIRDAIAAALKLLQPARLGDAIYAITDGEDNVSHTSAPKTRAALLASGVRLFLFWLAEARPEEREGLDSVLELAGDTGGLVFGLSGRYNDIFPSVPSWTSEYDYNDRTREKIRNYTRELNLQVNGFYLLRVATPELHKESSVKLEIVDAKGIPRKDVAFIFQRRLLPRERR